MSAVLKSQKKDREIQLVDLALEAWSAWSISNSVNLRMISAGIVMGIPRVYEARYLLPLTEDEMLLIDKTVANLPQRLKRVVFVEYFKVGPITVKCQLVGLRAGAYSLRVDGARWAVYGALQELVNRWVGKMR